MGYAFGVFVLYVYFYFSFHVSLEPRDERMDTLRRDRIKNNIIKNYIYVCTSIHMREERRDGVSAGDKEGREGEIERE